ncbi:hypothetical protein SPECIALG_168 [Erwinia phage vB_EamM_Special G]|uniref:Uncharacterized protein n=1 Tax=Erwinia phage vB_EamM_Special G TaxID=1815989 RepID=A0A191ZC61_9CAUD|nr:hypothetical protein FDI00_gp168 [Erwinia phage vB_EamM_Special G]ANJ64978.1 hypothetical protein SPECIALG_168 [Erwinia phage vB_EamM_Special G]
MSQVSLYDNANVVANIISVTTAVHEAVAGNEIAALSSPKDPGALSFLIAAKLQARMASMIANGANK